ncbi:MAG: hypothetical protein QOH28_3099 [Actinomycetota bacterium]|nr:hypothetical protein [Actinomycetota bacterium]
MDRGNPEPHARRERQTEPKPEPRPRPTDPEVEPAAAGATLLDIDRGAAVPHRGPVRRQGVVLTTDRGALLDGARPGYAAMCSTAAPSRLLRQHLGHRNDTSPSYPSPAPRPATPLTEVGAGTPEAVASSAAAAGSRR